MSANINQSSKMYLKKGIRLIDGFCKTTSLSPVDPQTGVYASLLKIKAEKRRSGLSVI